MFIAVHFYQCLFEKFTAKLKHYHKNLQMSSISLSLPPPPLPTPRKKKIVTPNHGAAYLQENLEIKVTLKFLQIKIFEENATLIEYK